MRGVVRGTVAHPVRRLCFLLDQWLKVVPIRTSKPGFSEHEKWRSRLPSSLQPYTRAPLAIGLNISEAIVQASVVTVVAEKEKRFPPLHGVWVLKTIVGPVATNLG